jgi:hypothetical protein
VADGLDVWLYGSRVATIDEQRRRPRLIYTDDALSRYPPWRSPFVKLQPEQHIKLAGQTLLYSNCQTTRSRLDALAAAIS